MDFKSEVKPLIEADTKGHMSFEMVRGGSIILTEQNTYIIRENILGDLESFEKINNSEIIALRVEKTTELGNILSTTTGKQILEKYEDDNKTLREIVESVDDSDVDLNMMTRILNRDDPATLFRIHLEKHAPTLYLDIQPSDFVREFLQSEVYRENYVNPEESNGV